MHSFPDKISKTPENKTGETPSGCRGWIFDGHLAAAFLLSLPLPSLPPLPPGALARAMWIFPLVGAGVGACGAAVYAVATVAGLAPLLAALLALSAMARLTGGLHEDGLADTADGFGSPGPSAHKLTVMRDSRVGTFGALALVFAVAIRAAAVAAVGTVADVAAAFVLAEAMGRAAMPLAMCWAPPARCDGLGATAAADSDEAFVTMVIAVATVSLLALILVQPGQAVGAVLAMVAAVGAVIASARHHIGGYTGDVLGAAGHVAGTAVLVSCAVSS